MRMLHDGSRTLLCAVLCFAAVVFSAGCVSSKARLEEFALATYQKEKANDLAALNRKQIVESQSQLAGLQLRLHQEALVKMNEMANGDPDEIAKNYIAYFNALDEAKDITSHEIAVAIANEAAGRALANGYLVQFEMSEEQRRLSSETARAVGSAIIPLAQGIWAEYQRANPVPIPSEAPGQEDLPVETGTGTEAITVDVVE